MSTSGVIRWSGEDLGQSMAGLASKMDKGMAAIVKYEAQEGQNHMRTNAPWTDRTGNARQGLFGRSYAEKSAYVIVLYHTMPYGIYLETRWSGRYRIVEPTLQLVGQNVMSSASKLLSALKGAA